MSERPTNSGDIRKQMDGENEQEETNPFLDSLPDQDPIKLAERGIEPERKSLIVDGAEFSRKEIEKAPVLIDGLLKQGSKMVLGGGSKSFKTWTLLNLGLAVGYGVPFWGHEVKQGRALYVDLELDEEDLQYRKNRIMRAMGIREAIPGKFDILSLKRELSRWRKQNRRLDKESQIDPFEEIVEEIRLSRNDYSLIILDPLYKFMGKRNENDAGDMADLFADIECLSIDTGAAVVIGVHFSKGNQALKEAMDRISGSGVFARDPDSIMVMTPLDEKQGDFTFQVEARLRKFKPLKKFAVRWEEPLMVRDDSLDADDLKGKGGTPQKGSVKELAELIPPGEGITKKDLIELAVDKFGTTDRTVRTKINKAIENNAICQSPLDDLFYRSN